ncbi:MAG: AAA family ATPase [Leptospiraceae bacterium]|nr:AAA family ATPase [Leptospiraceae bacterium]MDW7976211.1 AAA family ATPase [Leptospiraceae bacterium]
MAYIIAIANQKGGVGKTTSTINISSYLGRIGKNILIVDMDPQGNSSSGLGIEVHKLERTIYEVLINEISIYECILTTKEMNVSILPANMNLAGLEIDLLESENKYKSLKNLLNQVREKYDYILIDCPPNLGILTINALCAADGVLIPLQTEYYALEGITQLIKVIRRVQISLNPSLILVGVLLTMFDQRTNLSKMVVDDVRNHFKDKVFDVIIPRNVKLSEAPSFGKSIFTYAPDSLGAEAYEKAALELITRTKGG